MQIIDSNGIKVDIDHPAMTERMVYSMQQGIFERSEVRLATEVLEPGHRVLELGTCSGYVAINAAKIVGAENILCYEANPAMVELAKHHFALNDLPVEITNCVLVAREKAAEMGETVKFYVKAEPNSSSLKPRKTATPVVVPVKIMEEEIARHRANVLLMDVEGAEADILSHADLTGIDHIMMETHYKKVGREPIDRMMRQLYSKGFVLNLSKIYGTVVHMDRLI